MKAARLHVRLCATTQRKNYWTLCPAQGPQMPRYFFNVINHIKTQDFDGVVLPNLETAKGEAEKDIVDIKESRFHLPTGDWSKWSIEICDCRGVLLLVVPFSSN